jgi:hypothetical protein
MKKLQISFILLMSLALKTQSAAAIERDFKFCRQTIEKIAEEMKVPLQFDGNQDILKGHTEPIKPGSKTYVKKLSLGAENPSALSLTVIEKDGLVAEYEVLQKDQCKADFAGFSCRSTQLNFEVSVDPVSNKCALKSVTHRQYGKGAETIYRTIMNSQICETLRGLDEDGLIAFQVAPQNANGKWKTQYGLKMQGGKRSQQKDGIAIKHLQNRCGDFVEGYKNKKGPAARPSPGSTT